MITKTAIKNHICMRRRMGFRLIFIFLFINGSLLLLTNPMETAEALTINNSLNGEIKTAEVAKTNSHASTNCDAICLTPGCVHAASKILEKIDEDFEPCDDFYKFSCSKYDIATNIPDDKAAVNVFNVINDKLKEQLKTIITSPIEDNEIEPFRNIKKLFLACMNKTLIEERGLKPLTDIHEELGGWPVVKGSTWDESKWTWQQSVKDFHKHAYSTDYIFDFSVYIDLKNTTKRIISIDQTMLGLNREYLIEGLKNPIVQAYHSYQVDLAVLYGAERKLAEKEMKEVLEFEFALADMSLPKEDRRDFNALYNAMTIKDVQARYPYNNWLDYFNAILPSVSQVTEDEIINVNVLSFFDALGPLLAKTPKRTIANYVMWRMTSTSSTFLTKGIRDRKLQFIKVLSGKQEEEPRWKECMNLVSEKLPLATGALYVRKYFKQNSKEIALEMVEKIKKEFVEILHTVPWMDKITRVAALSKIEKTIHNIGYPNELMDDNKLIEYYKSLIIDQDKFLDSILNIKFFDEDRNFKNLYEAFNRSDWRYFSGAAVVNAYYEPTKNSIEFPAGILQGHFFSADRPRYMNYGAIGVVIGHEITHLFDDQGRQFDLDGNLVDWWEEETKKAYLEKARCIIEQYGNYTEPNVKLNLNGINTQGENIADNGGVKEAYLAYQKFVTENGPEQKLPGLKYTANQLFWISTAQIWCSVYRPEQMKLFITTNEHSPGIFRVLGPLSNMKEFSKDFDCPAGSPMNPTHKCEVW